MTNWHRLGVAALHGAYANGETTPVTVTRHLLDRIARLNPMLNAIETLDDNRALAAAAESAARFGEGAGRALEGVPVLVKSNIAVAGLPWTAGLAGRRAVIADADAPCVARLRAAGAVVLGAATMHEGALGATTDNPHFGRALNPHGAGRTPGGSSGGSGAAVAAGFCAVALGSDTLGSIRIPAAFNGVYGLKPTFGAVDANGVFPLDAALDCVGPLARSLDDLEQVMAVLTGERPGAGPTTPRVAMAAHPGELTPAVAVAYARACAVLPAERVALPAAREAARYAGFFAAARALGATLTDTERAALSPALAATVAMAEQRDAVGRAADAGLMRDLGAFGRDTLAAYDVLLLPAVPIAAHPQGGRAGRVGRQPHHPRQRRRAARGRDPGRRRRGRAAGGGAAGRARGR